MVELEAAEEIPFRFPLDADQVHSAEPTMRWSATARIVTSAMAP
jgi:hypothetical protein